MNNDKVNELFPLVSIIVPVYNRSALLEEAIRSCVSQTYRPIECIVVDDGSVEDIRSVVEHFKTALLNDPSFDLIYIYQNNAGSQVARNTGTAAATGAFIQYLDSDDLLYPEKVAAQIACFQNHTDTDVVFGDWEVGTKEAKHTETAYLSENLVQQMLTGRCIHTLAMLMRVQLVRKIGNWDVTIKRNQEIDYQLRAVMLNANFKYLPGLNGLWRTHEEERITNSAGLLQTLHFFKKWEKILMEKKILFPSLKKEIARIFYWFCTANSKQYHPEMIIMLKEAIRLDPDIAFAQSGKIRLLRKIFGWNTALKIWLLKFYRNRPATNI